MTLEQQLEEMLKRSSEYTEPLVMISREDNRYRIAVSLGRTESCSFYGETLAAAADNAIHGLSSTLQQAALKNLEEAEKQADYWRRRFEKLERCSLGG